VQLEGDAEVEHDGTAFARHQHVVGLEIAVQLAGRVHRDEAFGHLPQDVAQALRVFERRREQHLEAARARAAAVLRAPCVAVHGVDRAARGAEQVREEVSALHVLHREEPLPPRAE
jgi:hypothetical protein